MNWKITGALLILVVTGWREAVQVAEVPSAPPLPPKQVLANEAYRLAVQCTKAEVLVRLEDRQMGLCLAQGAYLYRAERRGGKSSTAYCSLRDASAAVVGHRLTIRGKLAGLDLEHSFDLPAERPIMDERIVIHNGSGARVELSNLEMGFVRTIADKDGKVLPELVRDRFVALPFRVKSDDAKSQYNDFSTADLIHQKGYEVRIEVEQRYVRVPADRRQSEGWAWTHGPHTLGIFKFDQENMQWSVLATDKTSRGVNLRFGGASMIDGEPSDLGRIAPGQTVRLGVTRYQTVCGGYDRAMYAFRALLDENGCRFPQGFDPPVHWEQLYDMDGAWNDRLHNYTKAIVEKEAAKGVAYSCEALYLDPGWDTDFATFLWGEKWLGPRKAFVAQMQSQYGLKVSLHTPLASWMSVGWPMGGNSAPSTYPSTSHRKAPPDPNAQRFRVPASDRGRRNLALLPGAKANASSVFADGAMPIHQIAHLNDGWYGNQASWIAKTTAAWAEIDLGDVYTISQVRLSNDEIKEFSDRKPANYRILAATKYDGNSAAATWKAVAEVSGEPLLGVRDLSFPPCDARWVRVQILKSKPNEPRLDEMQIFEARPLAAKDLAAWESKQARRSLASPKSVLGGSTICLGSKAYLDEAAKRLLANCADGVIYVMFDGNWYQGGCDDPTHGHPVPFTKEDHMRANLELARRVHEKYPHVLIEMHDMVMGGHPARNTPVYYKYGLPGSYDLNWGFEQMWECLGDITSGRNRALYYYNLGCNVPIYLHINLSKDTPGCVVLWWYASTCRHLGIGGTHKDPAIVAAQKAGMKKYHDLERFFKRGEFYGINEEIHLHALPEENAFVANLFNLSDQKRTIAGHIELGQMGLKAGRLEGGAEDVGSLSKGVWAIRRELPPWSAAVIHVRLGR
jgi:hypothetical protein